MSLTSSQVDLVGGAVAVIIASAPIVKLLVTIRKVTNNSEVWVGDSGVSAEDGLKVSDGIQIPLDIGDKLYAMVIDGYGDETISVVISSAMM